MRSGGQKEALAALGLIDSWIRSDAGMPKSVTGSLDKFFESLADVPVKEILVTGQPWGALEELLLGKKINSGLTFTLPKKGDATYDEAAPWIELLTEVRHFTVILCPMRMNVVC